MELISRFLLILLKSLMAQMQVPDPMRLFHGVRLLSEQSLSKFIVKQPSAGQSLSPRHLLETLLFLIELQNQQRLTSIHKLQNSALSKKKVNGSNGNSSQRFFTSVKARVRKLMPTQKMNFSKREGKRFKANKKANMAKSLWK